MFESLSDKLQDIIAKTSGQKEKQKAQSIKKC